MGWKPLKRRLEYWAIGIVLIAMMIVATLGPLYLHTKFGSPTLDMVGKAKSEVVKER